MTMTTPRIQDAPLWQRWLYALKPASWPKVLSPALLGLGLALDHPQGRLLAGIALAVPHALATVAFLVTTNDWADRRVDTIKRQRFPDGCSPKTIPDGILASRALGAASVLLAIAMAVFGALGGLLHRSMQPALWAVLGVVALTAYSLPPLELNYRGGGELVEAGGVSIGMPMAAASFIHPIALRGSLLWLLGGLFFVSLASAIASGLSDEESDREGGKRTVTTTFGNRVARALTLIALAAGGGVWLAGQLAGALPNATALPLILLVLFGLRARGRSAAAVTGAFAAQTKFKQELHRAIWGSTLAWAVLVALTGLPR
jgi:4-hydroxybenzoate polyprenyltransferase